MEKIFLNYNLSHINTLAKIALHLGLQISTWIIIEFKLVALTRFSHFFSLIMTAVGIAIYTHISKLYIINMNYILYIIYIYMYYNHISVIGGFRRKKRSWISGRDEYLFCRDKSGSSMPKKKSRGPPTRLVRFFFPSSTAARDDFNRKITTRFRDDCSRSRWWWRCEWIL